MQCHPVPVCDITYIRLTSERTDNSEENKKTETTKLPMGGAVFPPGCSNELLNQGYTLHLHSVSEAVVVG